MKVKHPLLVLSSEAGVFFLRVMKHEIRWNPELQEWFCVRCGRVSNHRVREDAEVELESFECEPPSALGQGKP